MAENNSTNNAHNFQDLEGKSFGMLKVLRRDPRDKRKIAFWICLCECGRECTVAAYYLNHNIRTNCGCKRGESVVASRVKFHLEHPQPTAVSISLSNGMAVIVDEEDYPLVSNYWWSPHRGNSTYYARATRDKQRIFLHSLLMGSKEGHVVDHINGNGLDNRRENLRWASPGQNKMNARSSRGRSVYKGVCWATRHKKWCATISVEGSNKCLGYFDSEVEAALAYDSAALKYYKEFANLNFYPEE